MKIIGSDFDGTITTNKVILPETRKQIKQFRDNGNIFIIVTGRSPQKFKEGIKKYNIDFFDYVICANGGVVFDQQLNVIKTNQLDKTSVFKVLKTLLNDNNKIVINTLFKSIRINNINDFCQIDDEIISLAIEFDSLEQRKKYSFELFDDISIYHNTIYTDIVAKDISKASELLKLSKQIGDNELYTIGDGENDICMLQCTNKSFTFNHVEQIVKNSAKYHFNNIDEILLYINENKKGTK